MLVFVTSDEHESLAARMCNECFVLCSLEVLSASKVLVKHFVFMGLNTSKNHLFTKVLEGTLKHSLKSA